MVRCQLIRDSKTRLCISRLSLPTDDSFLVRIFDICSSVCTIHISLLFCRCVGLLSPPKGLLLFGPPGTGKTLIGKWIASSLKATFFAVTPATLTSKWFGEGEKMVRTLFEVARTRLPAIVFIDEVDSLLGQRKNDESEGTIRMKTEFLVQMDGLNTATEERLLVIGATNRPQEIDEAARRRFAHRLYVPLPKKDARRQIIVKQLAANAHALTVDNLERIAEKTEGFSGSDMVNLCKCACSLMLDKFLEGREDSSLEYISDEQVFVCVFCYTAYLSYVVEAFVNMLGSEEGFGSTEMFAVKFSEVQVHVRFSRSGLYT